VVTAVGLAMVAAGVTGCGDDDDSDAGDDDASDTTGPYAVGTRRLNLVDDSRETPAFGDQPAKPERTMATDVWYPAAGDPSAPTTPDADPADGPFPVVVFNHGQQGEPQQYALSFETWTRAGYVVAAPRHPITIRGGPGGQFVNDIEGELGDVPFVIDALEDELGDLADVDNLAVAGHSSGAIVAYGTGFNTCCHDDRFDAVLVEAFLPIPLDGEYAHDLEGTPVMFLHGTADAGAPIASAKRTYEGAEAPKFFVTIDGGNHSDDFRFGARAEVVANAALEFFDFALKDQAGAVDALNRIPGVEAVSD
jgi:fermentation-respiration switch protein FrsA (DUF1100 family)